MTCSVNRTPCWLPHTALTIPVLTVPLSTLKGMSYRAHKTTFSVIRNALHGYLQNKRSDNHGEQRPSTEESYHLLTPPPHFLPSPHASLIPSLPSPHPSPASSWVWCQWGVWQALITVSGGGDSGDRWVCPSLTPGVGVSDQAVRPPPVSDTGLSHTMSLNPSYCLPLCSVHAPLWVWSQYKGGCWCVEMCFFFGGGGILAFTLMYPLCWLVCTAVSLWHFISIYVLLTRCKKTWFLSKYKMPMVLSCM